VQFGVGGPERGRKSAQKPLQKERIKETREGRVTGRRGKKREMRSAATSGETHAFKPNEGIRTHS